MNLYSQQFTPDYPISIKPMGKIAGYFPAGLFDVNGALALPVGVNFTLHTHGGTSCELLLFHRDSEEPYAILPPSRGL